MQTDCRKLLAHFGILNARVGEREQLSWNEVFLERVYGAVEEAYLVKTKFGGLTPPAEVATSHQQVIDCIDYRINGINYVTEMLSGRLIDLPDKDPCQVIDLALKQLNDYSGK